MTGYNVLAASLAVLGNAAPATPTGTSGSSGATGLSYGLALGIAAVAVVAAVVAAALLWSRGRHGSYGGLITGLDNRYSTGKTIAVAWTVLVAWMVISEALVAAFHRNPSYTFSGLLSSASDLYFVFLGGPYAAAAFAKASVQTKVAQGTLAKTTGTRSFADFYSDDNGNADLYDFQYVLFNIIALLIVIFSFCAHPGNGLPDIPSFLAILTGGSALTYTVNKAIASGGPAITSVSPPKARIGDIVTIAGTQLLSTTAGAALPDVKFGPISATGVGIAAGTTDSLVATIADAPAGTTPLSGFVDVVVTPPSASPITDLKAVEIAADDPSIQAVGVQPVKANDLITVTGFLLLAPGAPAGTADPARPASAG